VILKRFQSPLLLLVSLLLSHSTCDEFLYFYKISSTSFFITFLSPGIAYIIIIIIIIITISYVHRSVCALIASPRNTQPNR
jgi:uncharacterized membrane protein (UPF0182 family)